MDKNTKKDIQKFLILASAVIIVFGLARHFHIKHFNAVVPGELYTAGQPRGMDYTRLTYKYHIATIVNVRKSTEHREENWYNEEKTQTKDHGLNYIELPIEKHGPSDGFPDETTQIQFLGIMADKSNYPVLLHSNSGKKRVYRLAAVWLIIEKGYTVDETMKIMKKIKEASLSEEEIEFVNKLAEEKEQLDSLDTRHRGI